MKIYITWHLATHGIAYSKNILAAFNSGKAKLRDAKIEVGPLDQSEMETVFDQNEGFSFDKVYYLYPDQSVQDIIKTHRPHKKDKLITQDQVIIKSPTLPYWKSCIEQKFASLSEERKFFYDEAGESNPDIYHKILKQYWRNIHHYAIEDQIQWFWELSNAHPIYTPENFEMINMSTEHGVKDMRDYRGIAHGVAQFVSKKLSRHKNDEIIINVSLGSYETQVIWFLLAETGQLPPNTRFISTYDNKDDDKHDRFKDFHIKEVPAQLIRELRSEASLFPGTQSAPRKLANLKIKSYLNSGFSILILGPRGIGKTYMVEESSQVDLPSLISANCASFADDNMAEAELFGYKKGAFTGANKESDGLFLSASGGILFLDEIHHLSKRVQAKLMTALQTNRENKLTIRRLGENKSIQIECQVVFASNLSIAELKEKLLPDFYDRIGQHIIEIPPLSQTHEDRQKDWESVWAQLLFSDQYEPPTDSQLISWLKTLDLPGNFRDLQKIAIYYKSYLAFDEEIKKMIPQKNAFEFTKAEYLKYHQTAQNTPLIKFSRSKTTEAMLSEFKSQLAEWAIGEFGGKTQAAKHFMGLDEKITRQTFHNWQKLKK